MKKLRFFDSQESRFKASKGSNICSAVRVVCRSAAIQEYCFEAAKLSGMDCAVQEGGLFADCQ